MMVNQSFSSGQGRQAVIAEGPLICACTVFNRAEVSFEGGRAVAIMHTALDHEYMAKEITDPILFQKRQLLPQTLEIRRTYLMAYVKQELSTALANEKVSDSRVADALSAAFRRMNEQMVETMPDVKELPDGSWFSQYNALVVVVEGAQVFVAGDAWSPAMLVRKGEQKKLTRYFLPVSISRARRSRSKLAVTPLCFFNRENLTQDDKYLVILSKAVVANVEQRDIPAVLQTRAKYFGLETACEQIVEGNANRPPRLLIVLPLDVGEETISDTGLAVEELEHYGVIGLSDEDENVGNVSFEESDEELAYANDRCALSPLTGEPEETEWHGSGRASTRLVSHHRVVCKYMSSKLVISMGDIREWHFDGKNDAIVLDRLMSSHHAASRVIFNVWDGLAVAYYTTAADMAERMKVKYIAFPSVGCGRGSSLSMSEAASTAVRTMVKCGGKFEEVHFVLPDEKTWNAWVAATDLLSYQDMADLIKSWSDDDVDPQLKQLK